MNTHHTHGLLTACPKCGRLIGHEKWCPLRFCLLGGLLLLLIICGCAAPEPQMVTAHGYFGSSFAGSCGILAGTQVIITDAATGKILTTVAIGSEPVSTTLTVSGVTVPVEEWQWRATVPAVPRYGVTIGGHTPFYASQAQMHSGLGLSC